MARPSELFATTLPAAELDPTYVFVRDDEYDGSHRHYLEDLWAEFEPHADRNFLTEFDRDRIGWEAFNDRVWGEALAVPREAARAFALSHSWRTCTEQFLSNLAVESEA